MACKQCKEFAADMLRVRDGLIAVYRKLASQNRLKIKHYQRLIDRQEKAKSRITVCPLRKVASVLLLSVGISLGADVHGGVIIERTVGGAGAALVVAYHKPIGKGIWRGIKKLTGRDNKCRQNLNLKIGGSPVQPQRAK